MRFIIHTKADIKLITKYTVIKKIHDELNPYTIYYYFLSIKAINY